MLSPNSSFHFLMRGEDSQSLQRHRSTSTPNVHMVSTLDPGAALLLEVREHFYKKRMKLEHCVHHTHLSSIIACIHSFFPHSHSGAFKNQHNR